MNIRENYILPGIGRFSLRVESVGVDEPKQFKLRRHITRIIWGFLPSGRRVQGRCISYAFSEDVFISCFTPIEYNITYHLNGGTLPDGINNPTKHCQCTPGQIHKYLNKISGPLLDRIDIQIEITPLSFNDLSRTAPGEPSAVIRERVIKARQIQEERYREYPGIHCNAQMTPALMRQYATPAPQDMAMLREVINRLQLSARAYDRILRLARTIADLEGVEAIQTHHLAEAVSYRNLDRESWGE